MPKISFIILAIGWLRWPYARQTAVNLHLPAEKMPEAWAPLISRLVRRASDRFEVWCPHVDAEWTEPECSFLALLLVLASWETFSCLGLVELNLFLVVLVIPLLGLPAV